MIGLFLLLAAGFVFYYFFKTKQASKKHEERTNNSQSNNVKEQNEQFWSRMHNRKNDFEGYEKFGAVQCFINIAANVNDPGLEVLNKELKLEVKLKTIILREYVYLKGFLGYCVAYKSLNAESSQEIALASMLEIERRFKEPCYSRLNCDVKEMIDPRIKHYLDLNIDIDDMDQRLPLEFEKVVTNVCNKNVKLPKVLNYNIIYTIAVNEVEKEINRFLNFAKNESSDNNNINNEHVMMGKSPKFSSEIQEQEHINPTQPYTRKKEEPKIDKYSMIETYYIAAIAHVKEPGINNLELWFADNLEVKKHYMKEYVYLKCYLAYMCAYSGKYDNIITKDTPNIIAERLNEIFKNVFFAQYDVDAQESLYRIKFYLDRIDFKNFGDELPKAFEEAIGYKYMKTALMDPRNIEDLVNAACNDVTNQFKAFDKMRDNEKYFD